MTFVDSGALIALYLKSDRYHSDALRVWPALGFGLTSNHIICEVATALSRRAGAVYSADRVADIYAGRQTKVVQATREDELEALKWMRKYAGQNIGFADCVSFALMRRHRIKTAFTFDRHFLDAGFSVIGLR